MLVGKLTEQQKNDLVGKLVQPDWYFYPVLSYGTVPAEWVISTQEIDCSIYYENEWIKNLPLIEFVPKPEEPENYFTQFFSGNSQN
jgi:hypothetical protein